MQLTALRAAADAEAVRQPGTGASDDSVYWVVVFKWDPKKAAANLKKHAIGFHEAATVLNDTLSTTFPDVKHSSVESRFVTIRMSRRGRILVVVHTEEGGTVRIISARGATSHERRFYEEG